MAAWRVVQDQASGRRYTVVAQPRGGAPGGAAAALAVRVTDGNAVWENPGVERPAETRWPDWMQRMQTALTIPEDATYTFGVVEARDLLTVNARWKMPGVDSLLKISFTAKPAGDQEAARKELHTFFMDYSATQRSKIGSLQSQVESYKRDASAAAAEVENLLATKERREEEMFVKFAALLDMKKEKLRQMRDKLADMQRKPEESGGSPDHASDNDSALKMPGNSIFSAETEPTSVAKQYVSNVKTSSASGKQASGGSHLQSDAANPAVAAKGVQLHDTAASLDMAPNPDGPEPWMDAPTQVLTDEDADDKGQDKQGQDPPSANQDAGQPANPLRGQTASVHNDDAVHAPAPQPHAADLQHDIDDLLVTRIQARAKRRRR